MSDPLRLLHRLYRLKLILLAVLCLPLGLGLMVVVGANSGELGWSWFQQVVIIEAGGGLFTTGLVAILFEYVGRREADEHATQRLRKTLAEAAPDIRTAVIKGFAFEPEELAKVASPATLDKIVGNGLALHLGDRQLAEDVYRDLREQVIRTPERHYELDISVALAPWESGPAVGRGSMFVATVRRQYRVTPSQPTLRFACVSDLAEHRELLRDSSCTFVHYFERLAGVSTPSEDIFQLVEVSVDGRVCRTRRTTRVGSQIYTVDLADQLVGEQEVTLAYTYRVLVQRHGHLFYLEVGKPAKDLKVQFAYGNCGIRYVNVLDYVASSRQPRITQLPAAGPTPSVEVAFDGWVFPKAGVAFVWVLEEEFVIRTPSPTAASGEHGRRPDRAGD